MLAKVGDACDSCTSSSVAACVPELCPLIDFRRYDITLLLPLVLISLAQRRPETNRLTLQLLQRLPLESEEVAATLATLLFSLCGSANTEAAAWLLQALYLECMASLPHRLRIVMVLLFPVQLLFFDLA